MHFRLDFTIESANDRKDFIASKDLTNLTPTEIELCANYILYGKEEDKDFTSCVDRGEVQIKTKYSSYKKKEPVSLDACFENPLFNENLIERQPVVYKVAKRSISRVELKDVPGMKGLWDSIDKLDMALKRKNPNSREAYQLKHLLITLRSEQYDLLDLAKPTLPPAKKAPQYYRDAIDSSLNYPVFPRGVSSREHLESFKNPRTDKETVSSATMNQIEKLVEQNKPYFDFTNPLHVSQLILHYQDIRDAIIDFPDSPLWDLLRTLDAYVEKANFNQQHLCILRDKRCGYSNKQIKDDLMDNYGIYHQENYISTIWAKLVKKIAAAAVLNYDEWLAKDYDKCWKTCCRCGKEFLRDARNFTHKKKASDGFIGMCKACEKKKRIKKLEARKNRKKNN